MRIPLDDNYFVLMRFSRELLKLGGRGVLVVECNFWKLVREYFFHFERERNIFVVDKYGLGRDLMIISRERNRFVLQFRYSY